MSENVELLVFKIITKLLQVKKEELNRSRVQELKERRCAQLSSPHNPKPSTVTDATPLTYMRFTANVKL